MLTGSQGMVSRRSLLAFMCACSDARACLLKLRINEKQEREKEDKWTALLTTLISFLLPQKTTAI